MSSIVFAWATLRYFTSTYPALHFAAWPKDVPGKNGYLALSALLVPASLSAMIHTDGVVAHSDSEASILLFVTLVLVCSFGMVAIDA